MKDAQLRGISILQDHFEPPVMIEIGQRTRSDQGGPRIISACAKQHRDTGVDELFLLLTGQKTPADTASRKAKGKAMAETATHRN